MNTLLKISALVIGISGSIYAGVDPKAKAILDELSKNTKSYSTIDAEVNLVTTNKDKKVTDNQTLKVKVKGKKYRLDIPGNLIVSNGDRTWSKNNESGEVVIRCGNDESGISPSNIFTIYEKGFSSTLIKTEKKGKITTHIIRLIPDDKKKTDSVYIYVDGSKKKMSKMQVFRKNKSTETYVIKKFTPNTQMKEEDFVYDISKTPKDLRIDECE